MRPAERPAEAAVVRGSSPVRTSAGPAAAAAAARPGPEAFLTSDGERRAFERASGAAGAKAEIGALLDALEPLTPASFNRVLHALLAVKEKDPIAPSLLDKLVFRATGRLVEPETTRRFLRQLEHKLAGQPGRVLAGTSPETRARLAAGSKKLADLFE